MAGRGLISGRLASLAVVLFLGCLLGAGPGGPQMSYAGSCYGDFNTDGDVDGADLAIFAVEYESGTVNEADLAEFVLSFGKTDCLLEPAQIEFKEVRSSGEEGGSVQVVLVLSRAFSGQITLETSGTAGSGDYGLSCSGPECTAWVSGSGEAILQVPLTEDTVIEEVKWLGLRLKAGTSYTVGAVGEHVISIQDNDAVWEGMFTSRGEELGFSIEILRSGSGVTAKLLGEGGGIIPAGAKSVNPEGIPFTLTFNLGSKTFSGTLPWVPLPMNDTLLGVEGSLRLVLDAAESTGGVSADLVQGMNALGSMTQMEIAYPGASHLSSTVPGSFVLQRRPAKPSTAEVPLEPSN
jgi:hypothetical protein